MNLPLDIRALAPSDANADLLSLSAAWAKRYIRTVEHPEPQPVVRNDADLRRSIAKQLHQALRPVSARAWGKTETLLAAEVVRHQIDVDAIDPWAISGHVYRIYDRAFEGYAKAIAPERFAIDIASDLGVIRAKFTAVDPRVIGFVSMQFHYTGQLLLGKVDPAHQVTLASYFKAIDDHLYMPLQRAYNAAGSYLYDAVELSIIQTLLPESSAIAQRVVRQVIDAFPGHDCYSGLLRSSLVQQSSIRDAEMFQTYIWVCLLEKNISVVQQELFPLCIMLYPTFNVQWEIVRYMLVLLEREFVKLLTPTEFAQCAAYLDSLKMMFSPDVLDTP